MLTITPRSSTYVTGSENESAIRNMVDGIIADPDSWNMNRWATKSPCGSTLCAGGITVMQAGYEFVRYSYTEDLPSNTLATSMCAFPGSTKVEGIEYIAKRLLGLSYPQIDRIFYYKETDKGKHPTVQQFVQRVADLTGLEFKIPV